MTAVAINLQDPKHRRALRHSSRIVASDDGTHCFTVRPDWHGPLPLPFRAAAATVDLLPDDAPATALILGYGLGAMAGQMLRRRPDLRLVGVEPDRRLVRSALEALPDRVTLHRTDAERFLRSTAEVFDLILDDCFVVRPDPETRTPEPYRPRSLEVLPDLARDHLVTGGLYVRNLLDQPDLSLGEQRARLDRLWAHRAERIYRDWDNVLVVTADQPLDGDRIRRLGSRARE